MRNRTTFQAIAQRISTQNKDTVELVETQKRVHPKQLDAANKIRELTYALIMAGKTILEAADVISGETDIIIEGFNQFSEVDLDAYQSEMAALTTLVSHLDLIHATHPEDNYELVKLIDPLTFKESLNKLKQEHPEQYDALLDAFI